MKKSTLRWWILWGVLLITYNVIVFAVPYQRTGGFWVSYGFTLIAIALQIYVIHTAFPAGGTVKSKLFGFPVAKVGMVYLAAQIATGLLFMAFPAAPIWLVVVVCVLWLALAVAGLVVTKTARNEVTRQEISHRAQTEVSVIRSLQNQVSTLSDHIQNKETADQLGKLAELLRYSDPMSSEALRDIETDLIACVDDIQSAVTEGDFAAVASLCQKASAVLTERNRLCKLNK